MFGLPKEYRRHREAKKQARAVEGSAIICFLEGPAVTFEDGSSAPRRLGDRSGYWKPGTHAPVGVRWNEDGSVSTFDQNGRQIG